MRFQQALVGLRSFAVRSCRPMNDRAVEEKLLRAVVESGWSCHKGDLVFSGSLPNCL